MLAFFSYILFHLIILSLIEADVCQSNLAFFSGLWNGTLHVNLEVGY